MAALTGTTRLAEYAKAAMELADEQGQAEAVGEELNQLRQLVQANPLFGDFLRDPAVSPAQRQEMLDRAFKGQLSPLVASLMGVMNVRGCAGMIGELAAEYQRLLDRRMGKVDLDITVPQPMDEGFFADVRDRIGKALGKSVRVRQHVDESLIGGMVLRLEDKLFDASVKTQLQVMKQKLMSAATP